MVPERTELEWTYDPLDFFEAAYRYATDDFHILVEAGRAVATLNVATDPVPEKLEDLARKHLENIFLVRQLQVHRKYNLQGPRIYQHLAGRKHVSIRLGGAAVVLTGGQADFIVRDQAGNVLRDSRAERITEYTSLLDLLALKLAQSLILKNMLESYSRSVSDPDNELVHLYEVRDALSTYYGSDQAARSELGISKGNWRRFGVLANDEPLEQGRHRGKHLHTRRIATDAELEKARTLVQQWIIAFADTL